MQLFVKCSYCPQMIEYKLGGAGEIRVNRRSAVFDDKMKCPTCGSTTVVEIVTKRKSKGKKQRANELAAAEAERAAIRARAQINKQIGDALRSQPGCKCVDRSESTHLGEPSGHPLSSGWSRDGKTGYMLPTIPKHNHRCPLHGTAEELLAVDVILQEKT